MKRKFDCTCKKNSWAVRLDGYYVGHVYCKDCDTTINIVVQGIEFSC